MARVQLTAPASSSDDLRDNVRVIVQTREAWSDDWRTRRYLEPIQASATVAPSIGKAQFRYVYGRIRQQDRSAFQDYDPLDLSGHFVRIKIAGGGQTLWTGVLRDEGFNQHGKDAADPTGEQTIEADEIGAFLDRRTVNFGYVKELVSEGVYEAEGIGWLPSFNRRHMMGLALAGNRSSEKLSAVGGGFEEAHAFSTDGYAWTQLDIVEYLLARHFPPGMEFGFSGQYQELDYVSGEQHLEGLSLWQCLSHLIELRRGLGWYLKIDSDGTLLVHVFSVLGEPISVGEATFAANEDQISLDDVEDSPLYTDALLEVSVQTRYDRVIAAGERIKVCCTLSIEEETLDKAWSTAEETAYKAGDTSAPGDSDLNDRERGSEKYRRVYQAFRVPRDWDFTAGNGTGLDDEGAAWEKRLVVPSVDSDGTIDEERAATSWLGGKQILRTLPLEKPAEVAGAEPEYVPILAILKDQEDRWVEASALEEHRLSVRPLDREMGLEVKAPINHVLALNHFVEAGNPPTNTEPVYDWENLIATVSFESDERLACVAQTKRYETAAHPRVLTLDVERAEGWYIVPGTVTGVSMGELVRYEDGTYDNNLIRDDSERLRRVAALALAWYGKARAKLAFSWRELSGEITLGQYIRDVGDGVGRRGVGTVVTECAWQFTGSPSTSVSTGYGSSRRGLIDFPGMSGPRAVAREFRRLRREVHDVRANLGELPARIGSGGSGGSSGTQNDWEFLVMNGGEN